MLSTSTHPCFKIQQGCEGKEGGRILHRPLLGATGEVFGFVSFGVIFFGGVFFAFSRATPAAHGGSQARGLIGAVAAGLYYSQSNEGSEPRPRPTPLLTATPDP